MAVQFQRRNIGVLSDIPTFENVGQSAYVDYTQNPVGDATAAMSGQQQEVLPPESGNGMGVDRAEQAAAELISAAERQRAAAGNPLNRGLSILGGVIGAPLRFLDAALGGGDMSQVTAPFRPQQMADQRFDQTVMAIQENLAKIRQDYAQIGASQAQALRTGLTTTREEQQAGYDALGNLASGMLYLDPTARRQRMTALSAIAQRYRDSAPGVADAVQEIINNGYDDATLAAYASMSNDEGARARANEFLYGNKTLSLGDGVGAVIYGRPNVAPQVFAPGGSVSALPAIGGSQPPAPANQIDFSTMSDEELDAYIQSQGGR